MKNKTRTIISYVGMVLMCTAASFGLFFAITTLHDLFKDNEKLRYAAENNPPECCKFEKRFRRAWRDCESDVEVYSRQSIEFVCWEEYVTWQELMDEIYEEKWEAQKDLKQCQERLLLLETADRLRVHNNR